MPVSSVLPRNTALNEALEVPAYTAGRAVIKNKQKCVSAVIQIKQSDWRVGFGLLMITGLLRR